MKVCSKCGWELPATKDYYNACSKVKSGLYAKCKQCRLEQRLATKDKKESMTGSIELRIKKE